MRAVIAFYGLPGSGKTTLSKALQLESSWSVLRTDELWRTRYTEPKYSKEESAVVFGILLSRIIEYFEPQRNSAPLVIEGMFRTNARIDVINALGHELNVVVIWVLIKANVKTCQKRIRLRPNRISPKKFTAFVAGFETNQLADIVIRNDEEGPTWTGARLLKTISRSIAEHSRKAGGGD